MKIYYRPLCQIGGIRPDGALMLAGGASWFTHTEAITRRDSQIIAASDLPVDVAEILTAPRPTIAGLNMGQVNIMGILNVTPDSFSDGGQHFSMDAAVQRAREMRGEGADLIDIGGESTRPGATEISVADEIARVAPVAQALRMAGVGPLSLDTRKSGVAQETPTDILNDVSGFTFDAALAPYCAQAGLPVCVMHAQGDPQTMQDAPQYEDVLLDVYDFLEDRIAYLTGLGIAKAHIIIDPGIGFGKTLDHNLRLLRGLSLFHGLGCPVLLGVSRKRMIGEIGQAPDAQTRAPGSIAVGLAAAQQGIQILRVHDVAQTRQALSLWQAVT